MNKIFNYIFKFFYNFIIIFFMVFLTIYISIGLLSFIAWNYCLFTVPVYLGIIRLCVVISIFCNFIVLNYKESINENT